MTYKFSPRYEYQPVVFDNLQELRDCAPQRYPDEVFVKNPNGSGFIRKDDKSVWVDCAKENARTKQWYIDILQESSKEKALFVK